MPIALKTDIDAAIWICCGSMSPAEGPAETVVKAAESMLPARGWYAVGGGQPAFHFERKPAEQDARDRARKGDPAAVGQVLGRDGHRALVRLLSRYDPTPRKAAVSLARKAAESMLAGEMVDVTKVLNPLAPADYDQIVARLSTQLTRTAGRFSTDALRRVVDSLDFDWATATDAKLKLLSKRLNGAISAAYGESWAQMRGHLYVESEGVAQRARGSLITEYDLNIGASLSQPDLGAIRRMTASQAHYVTDFTTKEIVPGASERARKIVQNGLKNGLGPDEIAKDLRSGIGSQLKGRELPYFNVVANAFLGRARSFSALVTMSESGITAYIWSSVLDEITTDTCFVAGTLIDTPGGECPIETIRPGSLAINRHGESRKVLAVGRRARSIFRVIELDDGTIIRSTLNHPFRLAIGKWKPAVDLYVGAKLKTLGEPRTVAHIRTHVSDANEWVYNLEMEGDPSYIAGGVVVHNCRYLDGKVMRVEDGLKQFEAVDLLSNPQDVKGVMPWVQERMIRDGPDKGKKGLFIPQGEKSKLMAVVERSGLGTKDDRGKFSRGMKPDELAEAGVLSCPAHGGCRSNIIPDTQAPMRTQRKVTLPMPKPTVPIVDPRVGKAGARPPAEMTAGRAIDRYSEMDFQERLDAVNAREAELQARGVPQAKIDARLEKLASTMRTKAGRILKWIEQNGTPPIIEGGQLATGTGRAVELMQATSPEVTSRISEVRVGRRPKKPEPGVAYVSRGTVRGVQSRDARSADTFVQSTAEAAKHPASRRKTPLRHDDGIVVDKKLAAEIIPPKE